MNFDICVYNELQEGLNEIETDLKESNSDKLKKLNYIEGFIDGVFLDHFKNGRE